MTRYTMDNGVTREMTPEEIAEQDALLSAAPDESTLVAGYMAAVQNHMDGHAVSFGYDNLVSVISYAEESAVPRYQAEGIAFRAWRSLCWQRCEEVLGEVKAGARPAPTHEELIALLPNSPIQV